jgi:hypothetical protein
LESASDIDTIGAVDTSPSPSDKLVSMEGYNDLVKIMDNLLGISYDAVKMRLLRARKVIRLMFICLKPTLRLSPTQSCGLKAIHFLPLALLLACL